MSNHIIQSLWIGDSLSLIEQLSLSSFVKNGHETHLYTYQDINGIPEGVIVQNANAIIPKSEIFYLKNGPGKGSVAAFSDIFRYKLLKDKGGYWVDTDCVCVKPFDFTQEYVFSSEFSGDGKTVKINNGVIKSPAGSEIISYCYERCMNIDKTSVQWGDTGPALVNDAVHKFNFQQHVQPPQSFCPVGYHALAYMLVGDKSLFNLDGVHTVHLWNEQWRRFNIDKNATFPSNTLIEFFKQKYL